MVLENIQAELGPRERSILEVDTYRGHLGGAPWLALVSMATRQQGMEMKLLTSMINCHSREEAEAMALVARSIQAEDLTIDIVDIDDFPVTFEIGEEGWAAIRRGVEQLADSPAVKAVDIQSNREGMVAGRSEDLKAIWAKVSSWAVFSVDDEGMYKSLSYTKEEDGEGEGWEGVEGYWKGLEAVIHMTELRNVKFYAQIKSFKPNFTTTKTHKSRQI